MRTLVQMLSAPLDINGDEYEISVLKFNLEG